MTTAEILPAEVTVSQHILALAPERNGRPALVDAPTGRVISYASFAATVCAAAAGLTRRGLRPGDAVGVYVAGPMAFALASHAVRAAGGAAVPVHADMCRTAVAAGLTECDVRIVLTDAALACAAREIADGSRVRQLICFGEAADTTGFDALLHVGTMRPVSRDGGDATLVAWASGPGGLRPLPVSHDELAADLRGLAARATVASSDVVLAGPPCGDGRGYCALLDLSLAAGATVVGLPGTDPDSVLDVARSHHGTVVLLPPGAERADHHLRQVVIRP